MTTNFEKLSQQYAINIHWDDEAFLSEADNSPCFIRNCETSSEMSEEEIVKYINSARRMTIGVLQFSVTAKEANHQRWINASKKIKGCHVIQGRSINHGGYKVWLFAVPGTKTGNSDD